MKNFHISLEGGKTKVARKSVEERLDLAEKRIDAIGRRLRRDDEREEPEEEKEEKRGRGRPRKNPAPAVVEEEENDDLEDDESEDIFADW